MIKNVIFDFGNVIGKFDQQYIMSRFFDSDEDIDFVTPIIMRKWEKLDEGAVEYGEYIEGVLAELPARLHEGVKRFFEEWYMYMPYNDGIEELVDELKSEGKGIYLLSNMPAIASKLCDCYKILEKFDGLLFSSDVKLIKPDRRIYELLLDKFSLSASECLFADDRVENVEGARKCGIDGFLFDNNAAELAQYIKQQSHF